MTLPNAVLVAQVSNLLYRSASSLRSVASETNVLELDTPCRLEVGDTAGWKPALRLHIRPHGYQTSQRVP